MTKQLLIFSIATTFMLTIPAVSRATDIEMSAVEQVMDEDISINVNGQTVTVVGAQGQVLEIVSLTGRRVTTIKIESPAQRIELNIPKGCYILKIGKVVRKVSIH